MTDEVKKEEPIVEVVSEEVVPVEAKPLSWQSLLISGTIKDEIMDDVGSVLFKKSAAAQLFVMVDSYGGAVGSANVIYDMIEAVYCRKVVVVRTRAMSAAMSFLAIPNSLRLCYLSSIFMVHGPAYNLKGIEGDIKGVLMTQDASTEDMDARMIKGFGLTQEEWDERFPPGRDHYMLAKEALMLGKYGVVDGIILKEFDVNRYLVLTRDGIKEIDTEHVYIRSLLKETPLCTQEQLDTYGFKQGAPSDKHHQRLQIHSVKTPVKELAVETV